MKPFIEQAEHYINCHQQSATRLLHGIGGALLIFSLLILLGFVKIIVPGVFATSLATLTTLGFLIYYFRLHWRLAICATPILLIVLFLAHLFSQHGPNKLALWAVIISLIVGLSLVLLSYLLTTKRPPIATSFCQLQILPLVMTADLVFICGLMPGLKASLYGRKSH